MKEVGVGELKVQRLVVLSILAVLFVLAVMTAFRALLMPLCLACFFAYSLYPAMLLAERRLHVPRLYAVCILMLLVALILACCVAGLIPVIRMEILAILEMLPQAKAYVLGQLLPWLREIGMRFGMNVDEMIHFDLSTMNWSSHLGGASQTVQNLFDQTSNILGTLVTALLTPVFVFFFLLDINIIRTFVRSLIPADLRPSVKNFADAVDRTLKMVFKRQLMVSLILAVLYCVGFSIVGLKFSLAVGLITGLCRMVPYLDVIVGLLLSFIIIVTDPTFAGLALPIGVAVVIAVVQLIDAMVITPRVIGDKVGLHPAVVIAAVMAFADWFGFVGVLIAIPVAAILKILIRESTAAYRQSNFYRGK